MTIKQKCECEQICKHYGIESQKGILTEECAELIQAVSKLTRAEQSGKTFDRTQAMFNLAEECADVTIMIQQILQHYFRNEAEQRLQYYIKEKLERQIKRIESEG
jgi:NTP pyrophosphatase (non-canonical NTP hydrolase)